MTHTYGPDAIAIVGMAGRFPKAPDISAFWNKLVQGADCISDFTIEDLAQCRVPLDVLASKDFVRSWGVLADSDLFDAELFGYTPREAGLMDPQQRVALETVWHALEDAGFDPKATPNPCGVFLGSSLNFYFLDHVLGKPWALLPGARSYGEERIPPFTATDYLAARVSYKLNLTGPSQTIRAACASSLISVVNACQMLADFTCDVAVAGGVSISGNGPRGYFGHIDGGMLSPSGRCRPFDAGADGSVFSDAAGCVVLRRLEDALAGGERIHSVIVGWASNNDGSDKVGFSAPSVSGQARVISQALERAEVGSDQIGAIEAHGSATPLGDAVEIAALSRVFSNRTSPCLIGAVKSNIGHANAASGIVGLIKGILQVKNNCVAPVVHFDSVSPEILLDKTSFSIVRDSPVELSCDAPYCGISSFGLGGINAHVVVGPAPTRVDWGRASFISELPLIVSAPTADALTRQIDKLTDAVKVPNADLPGIARMLSTGRHHFPCRRAAIVVPGKQVPAIPRQPSRGPGSTAQIVFLCSGVGLSPVGLGCTPYSHFPSFRTAFDACREHCRERWSISIDAILNGGEDSDTVVLHAGLFALQYATSSMYRALGLQPAAVIGHSLGECIALAVSEALPWHSTLDFIVARAQALRKAESGRMIALPMNAELVRSYCDRETFVAAINGPEFTVVAGNESAIVKLQKRLSEKGQRAWPLPGDRAMHTPYMESACVDVMKAFPQEALREPTVRLELCDDDDRGHLADPVRWQRHLVEPVYWEDAIGRCVGTRPTVLIELGPGGALVGMTEDALRRGKAELLALESHPMKVASGFAPGPLPSLARLWEQGFEIPWRAVWSGLRVRAPQDSVPGYAFAPSRFWMESEADAAAPAVTASKSRDAVRTKGDLRAVLREVWSAVTGISDIDDDAEFQDIGGTSFVALQICNALWREHQIELRITELLNLGSLSRIAKYIEAQNPPRLETPDPDKLVLDLFGVREDDHILDPTELNSLIPDIIAAVRRHLDQVIYPNEIERCSTFKDLRRLIWRIAQLNDRQSALFVRSGSATERPLELPVMFLLSAPRSGSTLLRVMLAGHPELFSPPELHLVAYRSMSERAQQNPSPDRDQGLIRAFSELTGDTSAAALVKSMYDEDWLTIDVYRALQEAAAPRILIDKSPGNTARLGTLQRIAKLCPEAKIVALNRHPYAVISSLVRNRFNALMGAEGLDPQSFAEYIWARSAGNILDAKGFWKQSISMRYEDLVSDPEPVMRALCNFLGVDFDSALLLPYEGNRMRDGLGDPNFMTHSAIDSSLAEHWRHRVPEAPLSFASRELAAKLGYDVQLRDLPQTLPAVPAGDKPETKSKIDVLTFSASDAPTLLFMPAFDGSAECYRSLARSLDEFSTFGFEIGEVDGGDVDALIERIAALIVKTYDLSDIHLAGWSFGGVLAIETAKALERATGRFPRVTLLDTRAKQAPRNLDDREALRQLIAFVARTKIVDEIASAPTMREMLQSACDANLLPAELFLSDVTRRVRIIRTFIAYAGSDEPYYGPVSVLRATRKPTPGGHDLGWSDIAKGGLAVGQVFVTHDQMLDAKHVVSIRDALRALWAGRYA